MLLRPALLVLALTASSLAWSEASDPPDRVVRLSYVEGQVAFRGAEEAARHELPDRPLIPGDRLTTERGGRAELSLGTATIRLDEQTEFSIVDLDATTVRIQLNEGTASIVLHDLSEDETFEIDTPNTAIALQEPGEYRLEVRRTARPRSPCAAARRKSERLLAKCASPTASARGSRAAMHSRASRRRWPKTLSTRG